MTLFNLLNEKDFNLNGSEDFQHIDNHKNFNVDGNSSNNTLGLTNLHRWVNSSKGNIDIEFDGNGGQDTLDYSGDVTSITLNASADTDFDLYLDGGRGKGHGRKNLSSLEVWTKDVETIKLGRGDDTVDLSGLTRWLDLNVYAEDGNDKMTGSSFADWFHGGNGNDTINGKAGDDILDGGAGADTVSGGSGKDVLYATVDLTSSDVSNYYGDWENNGNGYAGVAGQYNEADVFVVGYQHTTTIPNASEDNIWSSLLGEATDSGAAAGAKILSTAVGASWSSSLIEFGLGTIADAAIGGADAQAAYTTSSAINGALVVHDFDPWADIAVLALDEYAELITATGNLDADGGQAIVSLQGEIFLTLKMDTVTASIFDGLFGNGATETLQPVEATDMMSNLLHNSVRVYTEDGALVAEALNGIDLTLGDTGGTLDGIIGDLGSDDGVWLIGNYGGGTMFGRDKEALAGSNGDDVLYSGYFDGNPDVNGNYSLTANYFSDDSIKIFGGDGHDVIFGSTDTNDYLFGGNGDDYLHAVAAGTGGTSVEVDYLIGGNGTDVASFSSVGVVDGAADGIVVNLGSTRSDSHGNYGTSFTEAFNNDAAGGAVARLYEIEGVEGTQHADVLTGSLTNNILFGSGGNDTIDGAAGDDTISGGEGNDILTGGANTDSFIFAGDFGADIITDFESGEQLVFEGISDLDAVLSILGSTLSIGSNSVTLAGYDATQLFTFYTTEDDGTVNGILTSDRTLDDTPLSDFEAALYLASHGDLILAFGYDLSAAKAHYESNGRSEGRDIDFDAAQYLENYSDLQAAFGDDLFLAARHFVTNGYGENRTDTPNLSDSLAANAVSASSVYSSAYGAYNSFDNDSTTFNHTGRGDSDATLFVDLGDDAVLEMIRIVNRNDGDAAHQAIVNERLEGATISIYDDGVHQWSSTALTSAVNQFVDLENTVGDEIRIMSNDGDYLHIAEIDIFGFMG